MKDFNYRKNEYYKLIKDNDEIYKMMLDRCNNSSLRELLFNPNNDFELEIAYAIYDFVVDINNYLLYLNVNSEKTNLEDNKAIKLYEYIIYLLKNNNENELNNIKMFLCDEITPASAAELIIDIMDAFAKDSYNSYKYLAERCGYNINDSEEENIYFYYLNKTNEITNSSPDSKINFETIDLNNPNQVRGTINCMRKIHSLINQKIKKDKIRTLNY